MRLTRSTAAARVVAVAIALAIFAAPPSPAQDGADDTTAVGRVVGLVGVATVARPAAMMPAAQGVTVAVGDRILTSEGARIEIAFEDGSRVVIGAGSEVVVTEYMTSAGGRRQGGVLSIIGGILRAVVSPGADAGGFDVHSRAAVASVRSTEFVVNATPEGTAVFTVEGEVGVAPREAPGAAVAVGPGEGVDVPLGAGPDVALEVKRWGEPRVARVLAATADP